MSKCEYPVAHGQCPFDAEPGSRFCQKHSANSAEKQIGAYLISNKLFSDTAERHAQSDKIKSLMGEVAILRGLIERRINAADSDAELTAVMPMVKDYSMALDKLVTSWHAMDVKLGNLLSKSALMDLAQRIIGIIEENVRPLAGANPDTRAVDDAIEQIGRQIVEAIANQENQK
jgi:hypothetical protein